MNFKQGNIRAWAQLYQSLHLFSLVRIKISISTTNEILNFIFIFYKNVLSFSNKSSTKSLPPTPKCINFEDGRTCLINRQLHRFRGWGLGRRERRRHKTVAGIWRGFRSSFPSRSIQGSRRIKRKHTCVNQVAYFTDKSLKNI